ncbi:MAG: recombinase-like helix-turn-helix domain-containing protein [Burkholderiales bacterium]
MIHTPDYNPHLAPQGHASEDRDVGKGSIERPEDARNIPWQTRARLPSEYENRLGDALEHIFEGGATDLPAIVGGLNAAGLRSADGREWTTTLFEEEIRRLGNRADGRARS